MKCLHFLMIIMDSFLGQHNPLKYFALTKEGIKEGIRKGKTKLLQEMVERKYQKGKSAVEIAEDLEITEEEVKEFLNEMILQPQKDVQRQEKE